ncbi:protein lap1-like isoform X2 [Drosophila miranda]|uniref:protein lap1-like isoform X2 n=1 Tax=Drosophila miranda TaxID=7229 RepID=UPI00143F4515|nr:protein lap1-like isoform X2 [Drosophila miranda]
MDQEQLMNAVNRLFSKCQNASSTGILDLNIADNFLTTLPKEIGSLRALARLNISCNYLFQLPDVVFKLPHLTYLYAQDNLITKIDIEQPIESDNLALVDLRYNTLEPEFLRKLMKIQTTFRLVLNDAEVKDNDYEDDDDQDDDDGFIKN